MPPSRDRINRPRLHLSEIELHETELHETEQIRRVFSRFLRTIGAGLVGSLVIGCQASDLWDDRPLEALFGTSPGNPPAVQQPSSEGGLKLGAILPVTGDSGQMGRPMLKTLPLLVDGVNRCGGVNGAYVSLVLEDEATPPLETAVRLKQLIDVDRVSAIVGAFSNEVSVAAIPVAVQEEVLLISPASSSALLTDRARQNTFKGLWARTIPSDAQQAEALAQLAQRRGFRTVAIVTANTPDRVALEQAFTAAFKRRGGSVVTQAAPLRYSPNADALTLESIAYSAFLSFEQPDAVLGILDRQGGAALLKTAGELELLQGVPLILTDTARLDAFSQRVGKTAGGRALLAGTIGTAPAASGPGYADFAEQWQERFNAPPGGLVAQTWDAAALVMLAAQAAKENTRQGIQSQLRAVANPPGTAVTDVCQGLALLKQGQDINYEGASGKVDVDQNGDVKGEYEVWRVDEQGQFQRIDRLSPDR